jgi:glycosyltransferase involved in cell wall biosynthesis
VSAPRKVVAAFHLSEPSGPARALQPALARLARDAEVVVAVPGPGRTAEEVRAFARPVTLGHGPLMFPTGAGEARDLPGRLRGEVRRFRALLRAEGADLAIVATTTLPALTLAARLEGVPTVVYATELFRHGSRGDDLRAVIGRGAIAANARLASVVVACSHTVAEALPAGTRSEVMYPPIDPEPGVGDAERLRREHGIPATGPCLATLGNVARPRAQDVAIRALAELRRDHPGARLVIGNAPFPRPRDRAYAAEILALAERLGVADAVHMCGFARRDDVFAACDVVLNPARFAETFGIVAMEALVAGRPVVSTSVGAVPEVLEDGRHALLVPPDRPDAMAAAVRRLLADPGLAERLVADGREHVRATFGAERQLPRFERAVALALGDR